MHQPNQMLQEMVDVYRHKIPGDFSSMVQFDLQPDGAQWYLVAEEGGKVELHQGPHPMALFAILVSVETLEQIYLGELTGFTAAARENLSAPALLNFRLGEGVTFTPEIYNQIISFVQRFFWHVEPECINLAELHSRMVHSGHAIPLFYHSGFRSAWYLVKGGEWINKSGETNPFPQGFVFISGEVKAEIGSNIDSVKAGEAYYIPPGARHSVWTDADLPLILLWLAWGEGE